MPPQTRPPLLVYHGTPVLYPELGGGGSEPSLPPASGPASSSTCPPLLLPLPLPVPAAPLSALPLRLSSLRPNPPHPNASLAPQTDAASGGVGVPAIILPSPGPRTVSDGGDGSGAGSAGEPPLGIAAIRFPRPVRLSSLRIVPAGVVCPGGVGTTEPATFTAELFLNVVPSDPVNALVRTTAAVWPAPHALDFAINMPQGVSTRLVIVRAPASRLTLSVYAHPDDEQEGEEGAAEPATDASAAESAPTPAAAPAAPTPTPAAAVPLPLPDAHELVAAIPVLQSVDKTVRTQALATLAVLARATLLLDNVLASDSDPDSDSGSKSNAAQVLAEMEGAEADAAICSILGVDPDPEEGGAGSGMNGVEARAALLALTRLDKDPYQATYPSPQSALALALSLARTQKASRHPQAPRALAAVATRLARALAAAEQSSTEQDQCVTEHLVRILTALAVHATACGVDTPIPVPASRAQTVLATLLPLAAEVTATGVSCAPAAHRLACPFLAALPEDDMLKRAFAFDAATPTSVLSPSLAAPPLSMPGTPRTPRTPRTPPLALAAAAATAPQAATLIRALATSTTGGGSSLALSPTPAELLAVVAPHLLASLATAPVPPLGIPSALPSGTSGSGSASDYAGKVYSAHEFRRERDTVSGLGIGLAGVGRKASRHVDEFR